MQNLPHHLLWIPFFFIFLPAFLAAVDMDKIVKHAPKLRGVFWSTFVLTSAVTRWFLATAVPRVSPYRLDWPSTEWVLLKELLAVFDRQPHLLLIAAGLIWLGGALERTQAVNKVKMGWGSNQVRAYSYIFAVFWLSLSIMILTACQRTL